MYFDHIHPPPLPSGFLLPLCLPPNFMPPFKVNSSNKYKKLKTRK